jgi:hypothetical protein
LLFSELLHETKTNAVKSAINKNDILKNLIICPQLIVDIYINVYG